MSRIIGIHAGRPGKLSEQALRAVLESTEQDYSVYALNELKLETCDACLACVAENRCIKGDGVNQIVDELSAAAALVFAAPEYWEGVNAKARAFWERVCFMGRHNEEFPLQHLSGVIIGVGGHGDAAGAIGDMQAFFYDARIAVCDTVDVQGAYACFECGFGLDCAVAGVWDIYPAGTEISADNVPQLQHQDPHLCAQQRRSDRRIRLERAAERLMAWLSEE